ncbi:TorF family putative porin [Thioalkalivibrio sp. AKL12]|uniref:TorF family putative porin n=1 Tax=Thioalkalivibrio sp. AKL12 TaxID=1158159 RepID=UPI00036F7550|nr:TorF family putative porin [Thioalkalivibrio sp. AKL12]
MTKFKRSILAAAVLATGGTGALVATSTATAEFSGNITIASDYELRGFSETGGDAAIQGGFDYGHSSGFYVGTWASNLAGDGDPDPSYELDLYAGFADELANGLGYDVGYVYYFYPDADLDVGFGEIYGELSYDMFYGGVKVVVNEESDQELFESGSAYYYAGLDVPFADVYSAGFMVGHQTFDGDADSYEHYHASLSRHTESMGTFSMNLAYADVSGEDVRAYVAWSLDF